MNEQCKYLSEGLTVFITLVTALIIILFLNISCKQDIISAKPEIPPQGTTDTLSISVLSTDVNAIELKISHTKQDSSWTFTLFRNITSDTVKVVEVKLFQKDTVLVDDGQGSLNDNTVCRYFIQKVSPTGEKSPVVEATTLAILPHPTYTWQEYEFGELPTVLMDICVLNDNLAYVTGVTMIADTAYGVMKWDGIDWKPCLKNGGAYSIFAFNSDDIWISGGYVKHFNGIRWQKMSDNDTSSPIQIFPIDTVLFNNEAYFSSWGTSSNDMYFGNYWGKIIHWDGKKGRVMTALRSDLLVYDITGSSSNNIFAATYVPGTDYNGNIYHYNGSTWSLFAEGTIYPTGNQCWGSLHSIWLYGNTLWAAADLGFIYKFNLNGTRTQYGNFYDEMLRIRGSKPNNICAISYHNLYHFNGKDWKQYKNICSRQDILFVALAVTDEHAYIIGENGSRGLVMIGTKNK